MSMPTTTPVVVYAADGTSSSEGALRYAVQEAVMRQASLRIVHVIPMDTPIPPILPFSWLGPVPALRASSTSELREHAQGVLERAAGEAQDLAPNLAVSTMLVHGGRVRGIVDESVDALVVVIGRETQHGLGRLLTGATTAGVASNARCPVVVVPSDWHSQRGTEPCSSVVVGIRTADEAAVLMAQAYERVSSGGFIIAVHAWELSDLCLDRLEARDYADEWQGVGEGLLEEALGDWRSRHPDASVETRVVHGHAASVLAAAAKDSDLLVVRRAHEHRPFDHLGSTVRALLLASPSPVEVVPAHLEPEPDSELVLERAGGSRNESSGSYGAGRARYRDGHTWRGCSPQPHSGLPPRRSRDRASRHQGTPRERR